MILLNCVRNKRSSDRRPLAPSNASSLTYDTVPVDLHTTREKREPAVEGDSAKGNEKIVESEGKQVSIPVYEVQYEPVEIKDGQSTADAEKGTSKELQSKLEIKENTMCSHHSYAVIEEDKRDALQEASSNSFPTSHKNEEWKDQEVEQGSTGDISSGRGEKPWRKRIVGSGYENVLSPDVSHFVIIPIYHPGN